MSFIGVNLSRLIFSMGLIVLIFNTNSVFAGGDPTIKDEKVTSNKNNITQHKHKKDKIDQNSKKNSKSDMKSSSKDSTYSNQNQVSKNDTSETAGFAAIEDVTLIIDLSSVTDADGMGSVSVQWQISSDPKKWTNISGATNQ